MSGHWNKFRARTQGDIREFGRTVICVFSANPDEGEPFAYTIGNWERHQLPELLVVAPVSPQTLGAILNTLSEIMIERGGFADQELVSHGGAHPVKIISADDRAQSNYAIQAGQHYGFEDYPVQQVLLCDRAGRFTDETGCAPPYRDAPVLRRALH
jgi:hypothetical protein